MERSSAASLPAESVARCSRKRAFGIVVTLSAFATLFFGMPSAGPSNTSVGMSRIVRVKGTTVIAERIR